MMGPLLPIIDLGNLQMRNSVKEHVIALIKHLHDEVSMNFQWRNASQKRGNLPGLEIWLLIWLETKQLYQSEPLWEHMDIPWSIFWLVVIHCKIVQIMLW